MNKPTVAVVGGESLLAQEVRELLDGVHVVAGEDATGMKKARVALLAGSAASSRRTYKEHGALQLIDLAGALEEQPDARLRAPSLESAPVAAATAIQVVAHPAAIALVMFLKSVARVGTIRRCVAQIFEPASARGKRGLEELQKQTVAVLSFQKPPRDVYDTQVAFNMLAQYGEEAEEPLEGVEQRIERHVASLLTDAPGIPMPSLRLVQAPVFHGYSISVWIEFEDRPGVAKITGALQDAGIDVRADEPPNNAGIAGTSGISAGAIGEDRNHPRAYWCWIVADNLRLAAENAVAVAKEYL